MRNKTSPIQDVFELQNVAGKPHDLVKSKVLNQLDRHCLTFLKQSPIAFLGFRYEGVSEILILDGEQGFIEAVSQITLRIPYHQEFSIIDSKVFDHPLLVSLYCWLPGVEETLRINGRANWLMDNKSTTDDISATSSRELHMDIEGVFFHCAKSIKRSGLWMEKEHLDREMDFKNNGYELISDNHRMFVESSPFLCLHTQDDSNQSELSPRGDPPGFVHIIDDEHLLIPDRPGNKRIDSMRNLLGDPRLGIVFLIPGSDFVLKINGRASLVDDPELLKPLTIQNKAPKLGILVAITQCQFHRTNSLKWQKRWTMAMMVDTKQFPLGKIIVEQTSKNKSLATKIKGELAEVLVKADYKKNMY